MYRFLIISICLFVAQSGTAKDYRDDAGHIITLQKPAQRVMTLAPSVTELLFEAGGGSKLVGTVDISDFPPEVKAIARIGNNKQLDLERIAQLKPDLILVWFHGNGQREVERLTALGIPMFYIEPKDIDDVATAMERIGELVGTEEKAAAAAKRFRDDHRALQARYAGASKVSVFYQIWGQPLMTINGTHVISDVMQLCGGENVFAKESMLVPQPSTESVVVADPDAILSARSDHGDQTAARRDPNAQSMKSWTRFTSMKAVRTGQLWTIPGDGISRHGPRILDGARAVCAALDGVRAAKAGK